MATKHIAYLLFQADDSTDIYTRTYNSIISIKEDYCACMNHGPDVLFYSGVIWSEVMEHDLKEEIDEVCGYYVP